MQFEQIRRVFIVDDDPFWTGLLSQILTDIGFESIYHFSSGEECVQSLHLNPNLVFLDYQMNEMDGLAVLEKIKSYYPGIGVVFCTAYEDLGIAVQAIRNGSFDYLLKSNANQQEVESILHNMISKRIFSEPIY